MSICLVFVPPVLWANPTGPRVVNGAVSFQQPNAASLNITNSPGSIIHWQGFSIGSSEVTRFIQQSVSSAVLNRVTGGNVSQIYGQLLSNGRVFLINPGGIVVGPGAIVDTAGFVASTLNMLDADFLAGKLKFQGDANSGSIINQGWIRTSRGGQVILVALQIENSGLIQTPGGEIILAAGKSLTISSLDYEGVQFEVQAPTDSVLNVGKLLAEGGAIGVFAGTLRHSGEIRATSLSTDATGQIVLKAQGLLELNDTSVTSAAGAIGGKVNVIADVVMHSGSVDASGARGGGINVTARNMLSAGILVADGTAGAGGSVTVQASGRILQTAAARLSADGGAGAGGAITLHAQERVYGSGTLSAAGSATGGTIKVLGDDIVLLGAQLDASGGTGGGTVLIGGDFQGSNPEIQNARNSQINFSTRIRADARDSGDGGKVVVWSDANTRFAGSISARGGAQSGDGGFVEVSGRENLSFGGMVDAGAPNGAAGRLLLDPKNIVIGSTGTSGGVTELVDPNIGGGDQFGANAVVLTNGNVVAPNPNDDFVAAGAGAVYLFNGSTGALISTLTGSQSGDSVGLDGVTTLGNGNFVVRSLQWANGTATQAGAVTFGNGTTGVSGVVSAANSLVGGTAADFIGSGGVTVLTNDNYVVASQFWANGVAINAGAVTFGNGTTGVAGVVSAANSLVGSTTGDQVGIGGVTALTNGNYVVSSRQWDNGAVIDAGAVTFGSGTTGVAGVVSAANSLVGSTASDLVGDGGVAALSNGNYVVLSPSWNNGVAASAGAVTFGNGTTGVAGVVSAANSLVGSTVSDQVGTGGVTALSSGNYVVASPFWDNGAATDAGAVTFGNGTTGVSGVVSAANSLVGSTAGDFTGNGGVTALSNGNYVVSSQLWDNGAVLNAGAVTFGNGATGVSGVVSVANSLVGSTAGDQVGSGGVTALSNGHYVVASPIWDNGAAANAGAVTFGNGTTGVSGVVGAANSLVGSTAGDQIGSNGVIALTNGNYVAISPLWDNGAMADAGAVTFGNGATGVSGVVSAANSLVGSTAGDQVGSGGVTPLGNGNYVVASPFWDNAGVLDAGAVTFSDGTAGITGVVSAANSLMGSTLGDQVGSGGITAISGGRALVRTPMFDNGAIDSGRLQILDAGGSDSAAGATFANSPGTDSTITPASITAITDTGTSVVLQANNDITLAAGSPITSNNTVGNGGAITLQAGRSVILNANITTDNGNLAITANDPGAQAANRDPGAGGITMAVGTTLNAGTGTVALTVGAGVPGAASGNLVVENITAANVNLQQNGRTNGSSILRASSSSLIQATNLLMEVDHGGAASGGSIGTSGAPMRVQTSTLEAHTHEASPGIFIESPNAGDLQIGGVPFFFGAVKGVQTQSGGDISIDVNGTLTTLTGSPTAGCGGTGGPICTGTVTGSGNITLNANDMIIGDSISAAGSGSIARLSPFSLTTNLGINIGAAGGLSLSTTELQQVTAGALEIGRSTDTGTLTVASAVGSGDINAGTLTLAHQNIAVSNAINFSTGGENLTLTSGAQTTLGNNITLGGTAGTPATLALNGATNWIAGTTIAGAGASTSVVTVPAGSTLSVAGSGSHALNALTLNNAGTVNWSSGNIDLAGSAVINNQSGANWNILTTGPGDDLSGAGTFNNLAGGTVVANASGGSNSISAAVVNHNGTVNVLQGNLDWDYSSVINIAGNINFSNGTGLFGGNTLGTPTVNFNSGANLAVVSGTAQIGSTVQNTNVNAALTLPANLTWTQTAGTLTLNAPLTLAGGSTFALSGGVVAGTTGTLTNQGTLNLNGGSIAGTVVNQGVVDVSTGSSSIGAGVTQQSGSINVASGQTLTIGGTGLDWQGGALQGTIVSSFGLSTLTLSGTGARVLDGPIFSLSDLTVPGGSLTLQSGALNLSGTTNIASGAMLMAAGAALTATGPVIVGGTLKASATGPIDATGQILTVPTGGVLDVNGGTVTAGSVDVTGGLVKGTGTLAANLNNSAGTVAPGSSPGRLTVIGDYVQGRSGTLAIEIGGTTPRTEYDQLSVTGNVVLDGRLDLVIGFRPAASDTFNLILARSRLIGTFFTANIPAGFSSRYLDTGFDLIFSPSSSSSSTSGIGTELVLREALLQDLLRDLVADVALAAPVEEPGLRKIPLCR